MTIKKLFLSIALFIISMTAHATSSTVLNELLKNIHSMQANFTQAIVDNHGKVLQKSYGKMALQRPGQFRWETLSPNKQLIIANGARLWIYDADLEQVVVRSLVKQAGETPALLLSDANPALETDFSVKETSGSNNTRWFLLLPKDKNSLMASIKMGFKNNGIQEMQLQDHLGHITIIQFQNVKSNVPVSSTLFHFTLPKHVDVIDETKHR